MLIWGSAGETKDLGAVETRRCDTCKKERPFKLFLQYRYSHIWYLFSWISAKKYLLLCDVCHRGAELDSGKVESKLKKNPIPFRRRYGWTFLVGLIALVVAGGMCQSQVQETLDYSYIGSPRVSDLYVAELSQLLKNLERSPMYGVMRVKAVVGDRVEFLVPKIGYTKTSGADKDISGGRTSSNDYYSADTLVLRVSELKGMRDRHIITHVRRN